MKKNFLVLFTFIMSIMTTSCTEKTVNQKEIEQAKKNAKEGVYALMKTDKGDMLIDLFYDKTPVTVANFVGLAEGKLHYQNVHIDKPFYDGIIFHRVIPQFMIQAGDPNGIGSGGPGYQFPDEIVPELIHEGKGILSMANAGPNTNGSQFFITETATPHLDGMHTVFGKVIAGLDIIDSIINVPRGQNDKPTTDIKIHTVEVFRKGKEAEAFLGVDLFERLMTEKMAHIEQANQAKIAHFEKTIQEKHPKAQRTASGLFWEELQKPTQTTQVTAGKTVSVHYRGNFIDSLGNIGAQFDASYDRKEPITLTAGTQSVIAGFEEGLLLAKQGQKLRLFIPYYLAYGERKMGPIAAFSNLVFDIEIVSIK